MTQAVQAVQNFSELQSLTRKDLIALVKQFKEEDTDCLQNVNGKSKNEDLISALAEHMGFTATADEEIEVELAVWKEEPKTVINSSNTEQVDGPDADQEDEPPVDPTAGAFTFGDDAHLNPALTDSDVMDFGEDVPSLKVTEPFGEPDPVIEQIMAKEGSTQAEAEEINAEHLADMAEQDAEWKDQIKINLTKAEPPKADSTGDIEVDAVLKELGLDGINVIIPDSNSQADESQAGGEPDPEPDPDPEPEAGDKPKRGGRKATIPMDAPLPVRQYDKLLLGVYGNILTEREEPFPEGHKYAGMMHEEIKLERFNPKAHEIFRKIKGHMHLVYTNVGATYLIVYKKADGTLDPVLEVSNKGRGHLRCKQMANMLQVAYNEKNDQEVISAEDYQKLAEQIELLPINAESAGA